MIFIDFFNQMRVLVIAEVSLEKTEEAALLLAPWRCIHFR